MEMITGLVLVGLCFALVRYARPDAAGIVRAPFGNEYAATAAIMVVTVLGSFGILLMIFEATGIRFGG
ncbi:hypothetical protein [Aquibium sp. ELW1220]|uniref:hypothetical protein n=1 Tax=Aquibium sp. ELW1220 TaxID=2976766 RepID=UPI0025AF4224|nr:hypothetical protein [Aquibium sp. ELW1220]MDN2581956.1 hypothetical protein [Aquibium sp. ELW1220]